MGTEVVVVGAGVVGAACAYYLARAGVQVTVVDRGAVAGGTSGRGEGNLLVSDKPPGPELTLALRSLTLWSELASTLDDLEYEPKGGLVVAATPAGLASLLDLAAAQRTAGVSVESDVDPRTYEPHLRDGLAGAAFYPQDSQVQPMLAAARLLRAAAGLGASVRMGCAVTGLVLDSGAVRAVRTSDGVIPTGVAVNAAGTWASAVASLAGVPLPVRPRRGFVLVTEPLPSDIVRHKVYAAEYVADVASPAGDLQTSAVIESTRSGTVLIGSSRERVGFDDTFSLPVLARLAAQAIDLFPVLGGVHAIRAYRGFRPYSPDHLPIIGPDPRVPGLVHACGHEGAGVGLAPATAELVVAAVTGGGPSVDPYPFRPDRFGSEDRDE